jgi:homoserine dehydrogenase
MSARSIRIGLLGCGVVGSGFVELLAHERSRIASRFGVTLNLGQILVRDGEKTRPHVARSTFTTNALDVLDGDCDVIVELVGGVDCAGAYVRRALRNGRNVVTANKALLATTGRELFDDADRRGVALGFEASVCGGIPIVQALTRGLAGDSVTSIRGILNGTSNYIVSRMEDGMTFDDALRLAQERGFAEAEPSLDVDGVDAEQKLRILASLAFDEPIVSAAVRGIRGVTRAVIEEARADGCVIRHVATATRVPAGVALHIEPRRLTADDPLARVRDEHNAIVVNARATGELLFFGKGAGSMPTAAAVLSDVISIARSSQYARMTG